MHCALRQSLDSRIRPRAVAKNLVSDQMLPWKRAQSTWRRRFAAKQQKSESARIAVERSR